MTERLFLRLEDDPLYAPETGAPAGTMREFAVPAVLQELVANAIAYREDVPDGTEVIERVLPDGAVRLIVDGGDGVRAPAVRVAGGSTQPVVLSLRGRVRGLSLTLRPGAAAVLLGVPAAELANGVAPLADLWTGEEARALRGIGGTEDEGEHLQLLWSALQRRAMRSGNLPADVRQARHAAGLIRAGGGQRNLREVAQALGVGERRMQQIFQEHVGLSPRAWSRLARLHTCVRLMREAQRPAWPELALEAGFYDQAHLANEFKQLSGLTPGEFLRQRDIAVSSKTPA
jgi:AraC-like DNA-binding protein